MNTKNTMTFTDDEATTIVADLDNLVNDITTISDLLTDLNTVNADVDVEFVK